MVRHGIGDEIVRFFELSPRTIVRVWFAWLLVAISGSAAFALLGLVMGSLPGPPAVWYVIMLVGSFLTLVVVAGIRAWTVRIITERRRRPELGAELQVVPHPVLVAFVSAGTQPRLSHAVAFDHHIQHQPGASPTLQRCWLIHTTHPQSRENAVSFSNTQGARYGQDMFTLEELREPYDVHAAYDVVQSGLANAVAEEGITEAGIVVDVTGGTAMMTTGGVLACLNRSVDLEYVTHQPEGVVRKVDVRWMQSLGSDALPDTTG